MSCFIAFQIIIAPDTRIGNDRAVLGRAVRHPALFYFKKGNTMILREKLTDEVVVADVLLSTGRHDLPANCPYVMSEGKQLEPEDYEILFLTTEERDILPDWWKDSLTKDTVIVEPLPIRASGNRRV